ncbi:MAG: PAS domain-containing protein [Gemmatimonas sp.]
MSDASWNLQASRNGWTPVRADQRWFEAAPHGYLLLDRGFRIVDVNPMYARLTMTDPEAILGRQMFDVFPDNPADPEADGVAKLAASFDRVVSGKRIDKMHWQRYDVRDRNGEFVERHWSPVNAPVLDDNGEVEYLIHSVDDVTAAVRRLRPVLGSRFRT